jgi:hypothetical protein
MFYYRHQQRSGVGVAVGRKMLSVYRAAPRKFRLVSAEATIPFSTNPRVCFRPPAPVCV